VSRLSSPFLRYCADKFKNLRFTSFLYSSAFGCSTVKCNKIWSQKNLNLWTIRRRELHDSLLISVSVLHDRQTDRQTDGRTRTEGRTLRSQLVHATCKNRHYAFQQKQLELPGYRSSMVGYHKSLNASVIKFDLLSCLVTTVVCIKGCL